MKVWGWKKLKTPSLRQNERCKSIFKGIPGGHKGCRLLFWIQMPARSMQITETFSRPGNIEFITMTTDGMPSGQDRLKMKPDIRRPSTFRLCTMLRKQLSDRARRLTPVLISLNYFDIYLIIPFVMKSYLVNSYFHSALPFWSG